SSNFLRAAERVTDNWHMEADQFRNRISLFERDKWFNSLEKAVAKNEKADTRETIRKAFLMMTESRAVLKNALITGDRIGILGSGRTIAEDSARIIFVVNRMYVKTTSLFWKMALWASNKHKGFGVIVDKLYGFSLITLI